MGTVLFGVAMVRAKVHPRVPAIAYIVVLPVLAIAARLPDTVLTSGLHMVAGAGGHHDRRRTFLSGGGIMTV